MRIWKRIDLGAERRSYDLPIDGTVTTVYKDVVTETKSDDLRKFVSEKKETRRFDDMDLGEIAYKEITETRYTLRCDLYEASDMSLDNTGFLGKDVQIQIRVGKIEANSKSKSVNDGRALFNEAMDDLELMFPEIKVRAPHPHASYPRTHALPAPWPPPTLPLWRLSPQSVRCAPARGP